MELNRNGFEASYKVERVDGYSQENVRRFHRPRHWGGTGELGLENPSESLWLKVIPADGQPWIGGFEFGTGRVTGLSATPCPTAVCVVAKGQGFWVPVLDPDDYEIIRSVPVQEVLVVPGKQELVFVDHTRIAAYGLSGCLWITDDLSWDGLEISEVTADTIRGKAWDSPANLEVSFTVEIGSGESEGGSSPARYNAGHTRRVQRRLYRLRLS